MRLPFEVRLAVYERAMEDLVGTITALRPESEGIRKDVFYTFLSNPHASAMRYIGVEGKLSYQCFFFPVNFKGASLLGPLALLHASSAIRAECIVPMRAIVKRAILSAHYGISKQSLLSIKAFQKTLADRGVDPQRWDQLSRDLHIVKNHIWKLAKLKATLDEAARFLLR